MRIGSLTGLAFQKLDLSEDRATVTKTIPGYVQTFQYDLVSTNPSLQVDGTLIGTSVSNLASQISTLKAMYRNKKIVWVDASDQYQGEIYLCRINKLKGPTVDSSKGPLIATFSFEAMVLLPWGTTLLNPFNTTGVVLRDLNGTGKETILNPLSMDCNYTYSTSLQSDQGGNSSDWFSWEFIVDNQNPFTSATSVQEESCDSTTNTVNGYAPTGYTRSAFDSLSTDTTNFKQGTGSLKGTKSSPAASSTYSMGYDLGSSGVNLSAYDRFVMWFRCDQAGQGTYAIEIDDVNGKYRQWAFSLQGASDWMRVEVFLSTYSGDNGFDITHARYLIALVTTPSSAPSSINLWIDDIRVEIGYINHCDDTSGWTAAGGTGLTFSNDTLIYKEGLASLKISGTSASNGNLAANYSFPVANTSISSYDFLVLWVRSDFGGNATGGYYVLLGSGGLSNYYQWYYSGLNANQWYRLVVPLRIPTSTTGSPSLGTIGEFQILASCKASTASNLWVDEIAVDVGRWTNLEFQIPDNPSQNSGQYLNSCFEIGTWSGSSYTQYDFSTDAFGYVQNWGGGPGTYALDGSILSVVYGGSGSQDYNSKPLTAYVPGSIGTVQNLVGSSSTRNNPLTITYTTAYGTNNRFAIQIQLPPATSDSNTGNYPSNDIVGLQGINKVQLKVVVYYSSEDTSYSGF